MPRTSLEKLRQIAQFQQPKCTLRPSNRPLPLKKLWIKNVFRPPSKTSKSSIFDDRDDSIFSHDQGEKFQPLSLCCVTNNNDVF